MRVRVLATALVLSSTSLALAGCELPGGDPAPDSALSSLADGVASGDVSEVPFDSTSAPSEYAELVAGLGEVEPDVSVGEATVSGDSATAPVEWTWSFTEGGEPWAYSTQASLTLQDDEWRVEWAPALVEPSLAEGEHLTRQSVAPTRGRILGDAGQVIVRPRDVVRLGLDKTRLPEGADVAAAARAIAQSLRIGVPDFVKQARATGDEAFVEALVVRADEVARTVPAGYAALPGAVQLGASLPLAPTRDFAAAILGRVGPATAEIVEDSDGAVQPGDEVGLSGLQSRYDEQLRGTPGVTVIAAGSDNDRAVFEQSAQDGTDLETSLDSGLQQQAERALATLGSSDAPTSALVAIRPSDGAILAAANGPGNDGLNAATYGQYAPGSTFKVVTSLALLRSGLTASSPVSCPATTVVDGKTFKNYDDYPASGLGDITLAQAVADSCNTAFINERDQVQGSALADAAAALGLGVDHDLGFPAYFGQAGEGGRPASETEAAANLIGQGKVLASPMAMAAVAASVAAGRTVLPSLLPTPDVEQTPPAVPLTRTEARALRSMMNGVVTEGSGSFLAPLGVDGAKTGTAEYGTGSDSLPTHAWMIAFRDDLAVAVFVETGESGSLTAGPVLSAFLR